MRVFLTGTAQMVGGIIVEAELGGVGALVLAGENQARSQSTRGERVRDWSQFDRFRSGPDNQPNRSGMQPSP